MQRGKNFSFSARISVSYKRSIAPDEPVVTAIYQALNEQQDVFIDQTLLVGSHRAQRITLVVVIRL